MKKSYAKQVKKHTPKNSKKNFYLYLLDYIKDNKKLPTDSYSKQSINYYLKGLKSMGMVYKLGYNVWEVDLDLYKKYRFTTNQTSKKIHHVGKTYPSEKLLKNPLNKIRGHGFVFTIPIHISNWHNRKTYLDKHKISYVDIPQGQRIEIKKNKVWLCNDSIVIYFNDGLSFYNESAKETKGCAINYLKNVLVSLEHKLNINLKVNNDYKFKVSRNHYAKLKSYIAKKTSNKGLKLYKESTGALWCITDRSFNVDELETINPKTAVSDQDEVIGTWLNGLQDIKETSGTALDPRNILKMFQNQLNINKHYQNQINQLSQTISEMIYTKPKKLNLRDNYIG